MKARSTMSVGSAFPRGSVLSVDAGANTELVKVRRCAGPNLLGGYTLAVRRYRWHDQLRDRLRAHVRRAWRFATKPYRDWRYDRCDTPRCLRKAAFETERLDGYCARHAPAGSVPMTYGDDDA